MPATKESGQDEPGRRESGLIERQRQPHENHGYAGKRKHPTDEAMNALPLERLVGQPPRREQLGHLVAEDR
jgi:hypothetical protein